MLQNDNAIRSAFCLFQFSLESDKVLAMLMALNIFLIKHKMRTVSEKKLLYEQNHAWS